MKYAVMSDVHANPDALAKAVDDARTCGAETFVCLGDIVGYGPSPDAAITLSREAFGNIVFVGHTHEPVAWRQTDGGEVEMVDEDKISIAASGKYVINVGTVGCPRSVPFASYVVVDAKEDGSVDVELRKLTFDYLGYRDSLLAANADVPIWLEDHVSRLGCPK